MGAATPVAPGGDGESRTSSAEGDGRAELTRLALRLRLDRSHALRGTQPPLFLNGPCAACPTLVGLVFGGAAAALGLRKMTHDVCKVCEIIGKKEGWEVPKGLLKRWVPVGIGSRLRTQSTGEWGVEGEEGERGRGRGSEREGQGEREEGRGREQRETSESLEEPARKGGSWSNSGSDYGHNRIGA